MSRLRLTDEPFWFWWYPRKKRLRVGVKRTLRRIRHPFQ